MGRVTLARQIAVGEPMTTNLRHEDRQTFRVGHFAVAILPMVVAKDLFINVAREVERLDGNVGAFQGPLQKRPEVFHAIRVNSALDIRPQSC